MIPLGTQLFKTFYTTWGSVFGAVYSSWFVCVSCGFVENWIEDKKHLDKVRDKVPRTMR